MKELVAQLEEQLRQAKGRNRELEEQVTQLKDQAPSDRAAASIFNTKGGGVRSSATKRQIQGLL